MFMLSSDGTYLLYIQPLTAYIFVHRQKVRKEEIASALNNIKNCCNMTQLVIQFVLICTDECNWLMTSHTQCQGNGNRQNQILVACVSQPFEYNFISTYSEIIHRCAKRTATLFSLAFNPPACYTMSNNRKNQALFWCCCSWNEMTILCILHHASSGTQRRKYEFQLYNDIIPDYKWTMCYEGCHYCKSSQWCSTSTAVCSVQE
jgi:hypothetical protein